MNVGAAASASGVVKSTGSVGGSQDKVLNELRTKIKELKNEISKIRRDRSLSKEQKDAKQDLLQSQIDGLQQQVTQRQQQLREERMKEKEQKKGGQVQSNPHKERVQGGLEHSQASGMISADLDLEQTQQLYNLRGRMQGRKQQLETEVDLDLLVSKTVVESKNVEVQRLHSTTSGLDQSLGEKLSDMNEMQDQEKQSAVQGQKEPDEKNPKKVEKKESEKIDTQA